MSPSSSHEVDLVSDDQVIDTLKRFVHFRGELKQELTGTHSSFGLRTQKAAGTQEEVSGDSSKHLEDKDSERQPGDKARETRTGFSSNHLAVGDYKSVWDLCKKVLHAEVEMRPLMSAQVISPDTILVWKQLERFQKQYNVVLQVNAPLHLQRLKRRAGASQLDRGCQHPYPAKQGAQDAAVRQACLVSALTPEVCAAGTNISRQRSTTSSTSLPPLRSLASKINFLSESFSLASGKKEEEPGARSCVIFPCEVPVGKWEES
eukprot:767579-Hanusia_phi.AAC.1